MTRHALVEKGYYKQTVLKKFKSVRRQKFLSNGPFEITCK